MISSAGTARSVAGAPPIPAVIEKRGPAQVAAGPGRSSDVSVKEYAEVVKDHAEARTGTRVVAHEGAWSDAGRRALDLVVGVVALIVLSPVMLAIALAVRLDSRGPALYRQRRVGLDGREFLVNKFRSMRASADAQRHRDYVQQLIGREAGAEQAQEGLYKLVVDDRITRVGRFLRRYSLDELPQLLNVVRGEMSMVGPRPVIPYEVELYPEWYHRRFDVKPGMTGLWQVSGRNECSYEEMVRLDVRYARERTLRLDLGILVRTVWVVVRHRGAA
jgi:lipopolysaccharide/colanic/teichoic acid biosynthesis glycosyltransferase